MHVSPHRLDEQSACRAAHTHPRPYLQYTCRAVEPARAAPRARCQSDEWNAGWCGTWRPKRQSVHTIDDGTCFSTPLLTSPPSSRTRSSPETSPDATARHGSGHDPLACSLHDVWVARRLCGQYVVRKGGWGGDRQKGPDLTVCSPNLVLCSSEKVLIILRDGKKHIGVLRSYDQFGMCLL